MAVTMPKIDWEDYLDDEDETYNKPQKIGRKDKAPKQKNFKSNRQDNTFRKEKQAKKKEREHSISEIEGEE